MTSPAASPVSCIPLYELHEQEADELKYLQLQVYQNHPYAEIIEKLQAISEGDSKEAFLQAWFRTKSIGTINTVNMMGTDLLDTTEQLLADAMYLGMQAAFCEWVILELIYFAQISKLDITLYDVTERCAGIPLITWKNYPNHFFLHTRLHKDPAFRLEGSQKLERYGHFFIQTRDDQHDIANAILSGNLRFLQLLAPISATGIWKAATCWGHLHILKWLRTLPCEDWDAKQCFKTASSYGHVHVLKWLLQVEGCECDVGTCSIAAMIGSIEMLKWAREQNVPWSDTAALAIQYRHPELFKWAKSQGCPINARACASIARQGDLDLLKWARENDCPWDEWTCAYAALQNHFDLLKWARANGCPWDDRTALFAVEGGHLDLLIKIIEQGCPLSPEICAYMAELGDLTSLKWAREEMKCPWDRWTCAKAAWNGHLHVLIWAKEHGCEMDIWTCAYASSRRHQHILDWAQKQGCTCGNHGEEVDFLICS